MATTFFHGGPAAVLEIAGTRLGADGELLCASLSVNVASRYGQTISRFELVTNKVERVGLVAWMTGQSASIPEMRSKGVDALIVEASDVFDFPVDTLFVINKEAVRYRGTLTPSEVKELGDGLSTVHDPSPSQAGFRDYVTDIAGSLEEALSLAGWEKNSRRGYSYSIPSDDGRQSWRGEVQCTDRKWEVIISGESSVRAVVSMDAGLAVVDSCRLAEESAREPLPRVVPTTRISSLQVAP